MISRLCKCGVAALLLLVSAADSSGAEGGRAPASWDNYKVVVERNIFHRDRTRVSKTVLAPADEPAPRAERYVVLTGIAQQDNEHIAFLEDIRTGVTAKARIGDSIAQGQLMSITLDYIEYESNGNIAKIEVGENLEGGVSAPATPLDLSEDAGTFEVSSAETPAAGETAGGAEAAILERLRQRRQKELEE